MIKYLKYTTILLSILSATNLNDSNIYDNSWALVVGINDYDSIQDLNYAVEDALSIKNKTIK